jgi:hypothetical protein
LVKKAEVKKMNDNFNELPDETSRIRIEKNIINESTAGKTLNVSKNESAKIIVSVNTSKSSLTLTDKNSDAVSELGTSTTESGERKYTKVFCISYYIDALPYFKFRFIITLMMNQLLTVQRCKYHQTKLH